MNNLATLYFFFFLNSLTMIPLQAPKSIMPPDSDKKMTSLSLLDLVMSTPATIPTTLIRPRTSSMRKIQRGV